MGEFEMEMIYLIIGAMFLAYAGMLMLYYNVHSKEKKNRPSKLISKGVMSLRRGVYEKAFAYFKIAYEYSEKIDDYHNMAEALYHIGLVYQEQNDVENAQYFFEESFKIFQENEEEEGVDKTQKSLNFLKSLNS
jgi:tetratricopeptide (TPR) repeat protein